MLPTGIIDSAKQTASPGRQELFYPNESCQINDIIDNINSNAEKTASGRNKNEYNDEEIIKVFSYDILIKHVDEETKDEIAELHDVRKFSLSTISSILQCDKFLVNRVLNQRKRSKKLIQQMEYKPSFKKKLKKTSNTLLRFFMKANDATSQSE